MKADHADSTGTVSSLMLTMTAVGCCSVALEMVSRSAPELLASSTPPTVRTAIESSVRVTTASELGDSATALTLGTPFCLGQYPCSSRSHDAAVCGRVS